MTADLIAFLRARLDDDAAAALDAKPGPWHADGGSVYATHPTDEVVDYSESADHIARHDPARTLRKVEATREVVKVYERACDHYAVFTSGFAAAMEDVLRMFAVAYDDHPDFEESWRP